MKITNEILSEINDLYSKENSAGDIRKILFDKYGLKVCDAAIRKRLKKIIKLRGFQEASKMALRKHLPKDEIINLYVNNKFSLCKLKKLFKSTKKTLHKLLEENSIQIRNNDEAIQLSNLKYKRVQHNRNENEKAYLIGLVEGDLTARRRSKHTIKIITNTTHSTFVEHIKKKFEPYGYVRVFPKKNAGLFGYMWCVGADLDNSFDFLLPENRLTQMKNFAGKESFMSLLSGIIDSDGSIIIRKTDKYYQPLIRIFGQNFELLSYLKTSLEKFGFSPHMYKNFSKGDIVTWVYNKDYYILEISNKKDVYNLLKELPIQHPEKIPKKEMAMKFIEQGKFLWKDVELDVIILRNKIHNDTKQSIMLAEKKFLETHQPLIEPIGTNPATL